MAVHEGFSFLRFFFIQKVPSGNGGKVLVSVCDVFVFVFVFLLCLLFMFEC